ncbi:MAG: hypothetical protein P8X82_01090 [Gemmatimonadales bacterium]|jgi:uncharacterized protein YbjQ (UPF0145 family)
MIITTTNTLDGADAILGVDLDYERISTGSGTMLIVTATRHRSQIELVAHS